jgi:hypothetical protein
MKHIRIILVLSVITFSCQKELSIDNGTVVLPTIKTIAITSITNTTASGGGTITNDGGATVTARGVCWSTTTNPVVSGNHTTNGTGTGTFASAITGLSANTVYYVRAYATNSAGTAYGKEISFTSTTTSTALPTVITASLTAITGSTATGGGNVTADGGATVTARGVCWSTTANPVATGNHTTDGTGTGIFTSAITGLTAGTTYHVRAYATNSVGTSYGGDSVFTSTAAAGLPIVITTTITAINTTDATGGGNVTADGGSPVTARGVCWSTTANPVATGNHTTNGSGTGIFTSAIAVLIKNTTYYVRAYATNNNGTAYGNELTITTPEHDIYIGGSTFVGVHNVATIWKNGVPKTLTDGTQEAYVNCIYVTATDVYAGGIEHNGTNWVAKVWKNGIPTVLTDGTNNATVLSVQVIGTDVYAGGSDGSVAKIWKNLTATSLTGGTHIGSVYVAGSDVYGCGDYYNYPVSYAQSWKNGVLTELTDRSMVSNANSVVVSGTDVYIGGRENMVAKIWKNGVATSLSNGTLFNMVSVVCVNGPDVYAAGYEMLTPGGISVAKYWKNGTANNLTDGANAATVNSMFLFGSDLFICGVDGGVIKIWKNGTPTIINVSPDTINAIYLF